MLLMVQRGLSKSGLAIEFDMYRNPDLGELTSNHISAPWIDPPWEEWGVGAGVGKQGLGLKGLELMAGTRIFVLQSETCEGAFFVLWLEQALRLQ